MSEMFIWTDVEFNPQPKYSVRHDGRFPYYIGYGKLNGIGVLFSLVVQNGCGCVDILVHEERDHFPPDTCPICRGERSVVDFYKIVKEPKNRNELFQVLIQHPSIRLHWLYLNGCDYDG